MNEIIIAALGSGCFGAFIGFLSSRLARHDAVKDKNDETLKAVKQHEERLDNMDGTLDALAVVLDAVKLAQQSILRDRIQYLGKSYIARGSIEAEELETFYSLHERYKGLGGNGYCNAILEKVKKLDITA